MLSRSDYVRLLRSDVDTSTTLVTDIMTTNPVQSNTTVSAGKCARLMIDKYVCGAHALSSTSCQCWY